MFSIAKGLIAAILLASTLGATAVPINLSFTGLVDISGASVGGVNAPIGSEFTLDLVIEDSNAALGTYDLLDVSYTTVVGTYDTIGAWTTQLIATQDGTSIDLISDPFFDNNPSTEEFLLTLSGFDASLFDDPASWSGNAITGDIIVRGVGGFASGDQLSGVQPYTGTLAVSVTGMAVPEPSALALIGIGLLGLGLARRKNIC